MRKYCEINWRLCSKRNDQILRQRCRNRNGSDAWIELQPL